MNIDKIVEIINSSGLVISPTDTVYGIMGDALNKESIKNVYNVKHRDYKKPLILLMSSIDMIKEYTLDISEDEMNLMKKFYPGCMTLLLKRNSKVDGMICNNGEYVGVRIPDNKDLLSIIEKLGRPVFSTSCNISGNDVVRSVDEIDEEIISKVDYIYDGGYIDSVSSTVVRIDNGEVVILREGNLSEEIKNYFL